MIEQGRYDELGVRSSRSLSSPVSAQPPTWRPVRRRRPSSSPGASRTHTSALGSASNGPAKGARRSPPRPRTRRWRQGGGGRARAVDAGARRHLGGATDRGEHRALAVIGADGANEAVRWATGVGSGERGFALEALVPADPRRDRAFSERTATFDFAPIEAGLGGYRWIFPTRHADVPLLNCGIAVRTRRRATGSGGAGVPGRVARRSQPRLGAQFDPEDTGLIAYDPNARLGAHHVCPPASGRHRPTTSGRAFRAPLGTESPRRSRSHRCDRTERLRSDPAPSCVQAPIGRWNPAAKAQRGMGAVLSSGTSRLSNYAGCGGGSRARPREESTYGAMQPQRAAATSRRSARLGR